MIGNTNRFVYAETSTIKSRESTTGDKRSSIETLQLAMTSIPEDDPNMPTRTGDNIKMSYVTSLRRRAKMMSIPWSTFLRNKKSRKSYQLKKVADCPTQFICVLCMT